MCAHPRWSAVILYARLSYSTIADLFLTLSNVKMTRSTHPRKRMPRDLAFMHSRQSTTTTFLELPRELRDMIYELALVSTDTIDVCNFAAPSRWPHSSTLGISPAVLRVSRQIHNEALDVLYGLNTFQATVLLDPRVPHQFEPRGSDSSHIDITHPMIKNVRRLVIHLKFCVLSQWPNQDAVFPEAVLRAFVLGGPPDLIVVKPDCCSAYLDTMLQPNEMLAVANTALAVSRGTLFTAYLLSYLSQTTESHKSTLAVCCPPKPASYDFVDFPWTQVNYSVSDTVDVMYSVPRRFSLTGQMKSGVEK